MKASTIKGLLKKVHYTFWGLHKPFLKRNLDLRNSHAGETCLILGNGGSLKFLDFEKLGNIPAIGCSYSLLDKRTSQLNLKYMVFSDPYELMPVRFNRITRTLQTKFYPPIFKKNIRDFKDIIFFTSLTNVYAHLIRPQNLYYFNYCEPRNINHDISGDFSYTSGALDIMLGVAKYLGFKKVILLGCDYLGVPKLESHFYAYKKPTPGEPDLAFCERIKKISEGLDVVFVSLRGIQSPVFESISFCDYFGGEELYRENTEIIDEHYLKQLQRGAEKRQVYI